MLPEFFPKRAQSWNVPYNTNLRVPSVQARLHRIGISSPGLLHDAFFEAFEDTRVVFVMVFENVLLAVPEDCFTLHYHYMCYGAEKEREKLFRALNDRVPVYLEVEWNNYYKGWRIFNPWKL